MLALLLAASLEPAAVAAPVGAVEARLAARAWLAETPDRLGHHLGPTVDHLTSHRDDGGETGWYVVHLAPKGYLVVAADDLVEPIVAFSATGSFEDEADNPLVELLRVDMASRRTRASDLEAAMKLVRGRLDRELGAFVPRASSNLAR